MSKILLYLDEDAMDDSLVQALRSRNVDVTTPAEANMLHQTDDKQLNWATQNHQVIYSFNVKDFYRLRTRYIQQGLGHSGIVLAPQRHYSIGEQMRGLLRFSRHKVSE